MEWGRLVARRFIQVGLSRWLITRPWNSRQKYCDLCDPRSGRFHFVVTVVCKWTGFLNRNQNWRYLLWPHLTKLDFLVVWPWNMTREEKSNCQTIKPLRNTIRSRNVLNKFLKQDIFYSEWKGIGQSRYNKRSLNLIFFPYLTRHAPRCRCFKCGHCFMKLRDFDQLSNPDRYIFIYYLYLLL